MFSKVTPLVAPIVRPGVKDDQVGGRDMVEQLGDVVVRERVGVCAARWVRRLLLRLEATFEKDPAKQQALLKQADQVRDKAVELKKQKAGN